MSKQYDKLSGFYRIMAGNYLDTMNYEAVVEKGIESMLAQLDPHSVYLTAKELQTSNEELGGGFSGIGIEFNTLNDTIVVVNTIVGGPAEGVGMLPNDRIISIDNRSAVGMKREDVPKYLRGLKGTKVSVTVFRRGTSDSLDFTITRDDIPVNTVDAAYKPDPRTGYIKVSRFGSTTGLDFQKAFTELGEGVDGLILDLRGNGGGFLPEAIRMSEFFLNRGQRIVSTEGNMYPTRTVDAQSDGRFNRGRLIVLVDELSASASEIVAGAVQDWDRGIVVGRSTFGKGLVQREFPLSDGSAVRLTVAKYLTPTGRAIQRPYERGNSEAYYLEHFSMMTDADALAASDSVAMKGPEFHTMRSGRVVYGGGGIRPDVVIREDTTTIRPVVTPPVADSAVVSSGIVIPAHTVDRTPYLTKLVRGEHIRNFVQSYLDDNRAHLAALYPDIDSYIAGFDADELLPAMVDYAAGRGVEPDEQELDTFRHRLSAQIKILIARQLWDTAGYYRVNHATLDETFRRAHAMMLRWYSTPWTAGEAVTDELVRQLSR